jgi:hypothetical protein
LRHSKSTVCSAIERNLYAVRKISGISDVEKTLAELKRNLR